MRRYGGWLIIAALAVVAYLFYIGKIPIASGSLPFGSDDSGGGSQ